MSNPVVQSGSFPAWLPPLHPITLHNGNWQEYEAALHEIFTKDFVASSPSSIGGRRWGLKRYPMDKGKEATFWHLISEGEDETERIPNLDRCARLCWVRPMIDHIGSPEVVAWIQHRRRNERRIAVSLLDYSYLVVLADRPRQGYVLPWTAYPIERERMRRRLRSEYQQFVASGLALF